MDGDFDRSALPAVVCIGNGCAIVISAERAAVENGSFQIGNTIGLHAGEPGCQIDDCRIGVHIQGVLGWQFGIACLSGWQIDVVEIVFAWRIGSD